MSGVESDADLLSFFDTGEHAEIGSYTPAAGGDPVSVLVILDAPDKLLTFGGSGLRAASASALVRTAQLPPIEPKGGVLVVAGKSFTIKSVIRDDTREITTLELAEG